MSIKRQFSQLLEVSNPDLFLKNAFRVTWLRTTTSNREVSRHAEKLKMQADLGTAVTSASSIFALDPPPSADDVREAMNKLKEPKLRLIDEFFWYWPENLENPNADEALAAVEKGDDETARTIWENWESVSTRRMVATHNLAVMYHMLAIDWTRLDLESPFDAGQTEQMKTCWKRAFDRWETLATDDEMWGRLKERIREINDPALPSGTARRLRDTFPEAVDRINAEFAVRYATAKRFDMARWHIDFMKETHQGLDDTAKTSTEVLAPTKRRIEALTTDFEKAIRDDVSASLYAAKTLLNESRPYLQLFDLFHGEDSHERNEMFDQVASLCRSGLVAYYNKTEDATGVVAMLTTTLAYASSMSLREEIQESIATIQGNQEFEKVKEFFDLLKRIEGIPPAQRLARFTASIQQKWENFRISTSLPAETIDQVSDSIAVFLRSLAIEAHNEYDDSKTGIQGIRLAARYAQSSELTQRIAADLETLKINSAIRRSNARQSDGCLVVLAIPLSFLGIALLLQIFS